MDAALVLGGSELLWCLACVFLEKAKEVGIVIVT